MSFLFAVFLVLAVLLAAQSLVSLRDGYRFLAYLRRSLGTPLAPFHPPAAVIMAIKGWNEAFELNIRQLLAQDYPGYRVIFSVASDRDAAYVPLSTLISDANSSPVPGLRGATLAVAGYSSSRGEKVHNLLEALRHVQPSTASVLAFADADAHPTPDWLRCLVAPLADPAVTLSTGFRWYLPGRTWTSRLRAAWDTSIATMLGEHRRNFAWGGSMAVRFADFERLRVAEYWAASVSDDFSLTRAVRDHGGWIRFEPRCLVASVEEIGFKGLLRWTNRQIIITRVYAPQYWRLGLASYALFCGAFLLGIAAVLSPVPVAQRVLAAVVLAAILALGAAKAHLRGRVAGMILHDEPDLLKTQASSYWRWWLLVPWLMLVNFVVAGLTSRIEWSGVHYELVSPQETRVRREAEIAN